MKRPEIHRLKLLGISVVGGLVLFAPTAYAHPTMQVSASHNSISANGTGFSMSGTTVYLYAYGLSGGHKTLITIANTIPSKTSQPIPPCIFGPFCNAGSFVGSHMTQPQDPCVGGGFSRIEIDAWTRDPSWHMADSVTVNVSCPKIQ